MINSQLIAETFADMKRSIDQTNPLDEMSVNAFIREQRLYLARIEGWLQESKEQHELDNLYKDSRDDYDSDWQFRNNQ